MANEAAVQQAVWALDLGRGKRVIQWTLSVLVAIGLAVVYTVGQFRGLEKAEAMDLAQLARNIARGQGYTTYVIRPMSLWQLKNFGPEFDQKFMAHPDLYNPPVFPCALAGIFKAVPKKVFKKLSELKFSDRAYAPERWLILPLTQFCLLLSLLVVYLWAKQLFDQRVAVTAALLLLFSDTLWSYGISGLPTTLLLLLFLLAFYCLFRVDQQLHPGELVAEDDRRAEETAAVKLRWSLVACFLLSAGLLGVAFLTRYLAGFLMVPLVIYAARVMRGRRGVLWAVLYLAVFLAVITPWLVRNYQLSQSLLGIAKYQLYGGDTLQRSYHLACEFSPRAIIHKLLIDGRANLFTSFKQIGSDFLVFFFVAGVLYGFRRAEVARLRRVILGGLACALVGMSVINQPEERSNPAIYGSNLFVLFLPLVAVFGVAFFYLMIDRIKFRVNLIRLAAIGTFGLVNVAPLLLTLNQPRPGFFAYPPYMPPFTYAVSRWFDKDEVGVSDLPWEMAWIGDRRTVLLPWSLEDFYEINDFVAPKNTQFVWLTPYMLNQPFQSGILKGEYNRWAALARGQLPQNFPLKSVTLLPPDNDQILFADRSRWSTTEEPAKPAGPPPPSPATPALPATP